MDGCLCVGSEGRDGERGVVCFGGVGGVVLMGCHCEFGCWFGLEWMC